MTVTCSDVAVKLMTWGLRSITLMTCEDTAEIPSLTTSGDTAEAATSVTQRDTAETPVNTHNMRGYS